MSVPKELVLQWYSLSKDSYEFAQRAAAHGAAQRDAELLDAGDDDPTWFYDPIGGCVFADGMFEPKEVTDRAIALYTATQLAAARLQGAEDERKKWQSEIDNLKGNASSEYSRGVKAGERVNQGLLENIAEVAHCGGLVGMSQGYALRLIRRLTLPSNGERQMTDKELVYLFYRVNDGASNAAATAKAIRACIASECRSAGAQPLAWLAIDDVDGEVQGAMNSEFPPLYTTPVYTATQLAAARLQGAEDDKKRIEELEQSRGFYKRRVDLMQQWQSKMRDPERTIVCDIIANGMTLPESHAGDRYKITQGERVNQALLEALTALCSRLPMADGRAYPSYFARFELDAARAAIAAAQEVGK